MTTDTNDPWMRAMRLLRAIHVDELPNGVGGPDAEFRVQGHVGLADRVGFAAHHPELGVITQAYMAAKPEDEDVAHDDARRDADRLNALLFYAWRRGFASGVEFAKERTK